jgi:hypothetical protein
MKTVELIAHFFHPRRSNNHRPRLLHPEILGVLFLAVISLSFLAGPAKMLLEKSGFILGYASNITASDVIRETNNERAKSGLAPLTANSALNEAALAKAQHMFDNQYWAHVAPDGTDPWKFFQKVGYRYSVAGENLARDFSNTDDMVSAWMASPTHKANIMNARYQEIGIAVVDGKLQGTETTLVVQLFGTPQVKSTAQQLPQAGGAQTAAKPESETAQHISPENSLNEQAIPPLNTSLDKPTVLGSGNLPETVLHNSPLFSPLQLAKAFFLAVIFVITGTLFYDWIIMNNRNTVRMVGKNFAHISLLLVVAFLLIFFKGGVVG